MADFDPKAYLASDNAPPQAAPAEFDPKAYLADNDEPAKEGEHDFVPFLKNVWQGVKNTANELSTTPLPTVAYNHLVQPAVDTFNQARAGGENVVNAGLDAAAKGTGDLASAGSAIVAPGTMPVEAYFRSRQSGNSAEDALKDARNVALLVGVPAVAGAGIKAVAGPVAEGVSAASRGAVQGAKEAAEAAPILKTPAGVLGGIKGAYEEIKNTVAGSKDFQNIVQQARQVLGPSESGAIGNLSDDQAMLGALTTPGDNPVKQWYAQKSAMLNPGQGSAEEYAGLLAQDSEARNAARSFNPKQTAADLKPDIQQLQHTFQKVRDDRFTQLQGQARQSFDNEAVYPVLQSLKQAGQDATALKSVPGAVRGAVSDIDQMINDGVGTKQQGLTPGDLSSADATEKFNRLQQARKLLDDKIDWADKQGETQGSAILKGLRTDIDTALKTSPDKVAADDLYSASKNLEDKFFGATEFSKNGSVDIDASKIKSLLGDNAQAARFKDALDQLKEFGQRPDLPDAFKQQVQKVASSIEQKLAVADQQRALNSFRQKPGPSSPAIQRLQSISGNNSLLKDAVNAPAGFLNQLDEFGKFVQQKTGQSLDKLDPAARGQAVKFWTWSKKNPGATPAQAEKVWNTINGGGGGPTGGGVPPVTAAPKAHTNDQASDTDPADVIAKARGTKFEPMLAAAAKNGPQALAVAHYLLSQQNPEYQELQRSET